MRVLNVHLPEKRCFIFDHNNERVEAGTEPFFYYLKTPIRNISVDAASDYELTFFTMHKEDNSDWIATDRVGETYYIGKCENITNEKIFEIHDYFLNKR
jgi:hypothetical protein